MILKALADYYQRLLDDPNTDIAPPCFERKPIDFLIVLNEDGSFENLRDIREGTGRNRKGRISLVPKGVKRSSGIAANLLWDTAPYVLGKALTQKGKKLEDLEERAVKQHAAFIGKIEQTFEGCEDQGIQAVRSFLKKGDCSLVFSHVIWPDVEESGGNISFVLAGEIRLICQRPDVVTAILGKSEPEGTVQTCAVTGKEDIPAELHTAIKGVWGAQSSGANIVSFNLDAFRSFGKKQGYNAPVGQSVEFAYTTALNYLLASENQRMQVGDASTVFWAKNPCDFEQDFHSFLAPPKGEESISYDKIRGLLSAVKTGIPPQEADQPFYVLGLAPNASRIAVRFWYDGNVKEIKERVAQHFQDLEMVRAPHDPEFLSLFQMLVSTATERKADTIPPNLGGEVARAVLTGIAYPRTLFANAIRRCKAEQSVGFARASIIKACLARNARISKSTKKEVSMALDRTYDNIGYVLGRLFAVLERIQEQAQGKGLNKTIRDTYFSAAASSPMVTFKRLQDLAIHHLAKIRNSGKSTVWLEKMLGEVENLIPPQGVPATLGLEDQGRFSVGYYHQRQEFFTKKETTEEGEEQ
jgi:CRISPR-associated protein Csd1